MSKIQNSIRQYTTAHETKAQDKAKHKKEREEMNMKNNGEIIALKKPNIKHAKVTIIGDGTLCLNKMNDVAVRTLTDERKNKSKSL